MRHNPDTQNTSECVCVCVCMERRKIQCFTVLKKLPWRLCMFELKERGHANKIWTFGSLAFIHWLCLWEMEGWVLYKSPLFSYIYTILWVQTSRLLLDYYYYSTSAHTNRPDLAHALAGVHTIAVCCHGLHTWKACTVTLISNHHFSLVPLQIFGWLLSSWRTSVH